MCIPGAYEGQNRALDPLELELQMVVSRHVGNEIKSRSSRREASALNCCAVSPALGQSLIECSLCISHQAL